MDLTVAAVPAFFATMGAEHVILKRRIDGGDTTVVGFERSDTLASLAMGVGSLLAPFTIDRWLRNAAPGAGRWGKAVVGIGIGAAVATTVADVVARRAEGPLPAAGHLPSAPTPVSTAVASDGAPWTDDGLDRSQRRRIARAARRVASSGAVTALAAGVTAAASTVAVRSAAQRIWNRSGHQRDLGPGVLPATLAILGWDFIYYWNHRFMHESRWLWAMHVVHHSSERYNLSTALRQPVTGALTVYVPYGLLSFLGLRPAHIETARGINLLYQYWIHTEAIRRLGRAEEVLNTPSHHRVHHGSNSRYIDRNHGSILIVWDRLFGTFQREDDDEPVVYGLTKNIDTFDPVRIATHEWADIVRDVARSETWSDRLSFLLRGPGWAYERHAAELTTGELDPTEETLAGVA